MRAIVLLALVWLAYHYSVAALITSLSLQTPLAYLGLVPLIALALGWYRLSRQPALLPIHDRQVDYIVGLALILVAGMIAIVVPATLGTRFWLQRLDLLSLPFFVAGMVSLLYGVRHVWILKGPILFLFLAWPVPFQGILAWVLDVSTELTTSAAIALAQVMPLAKPSGGDGLFIVQHASTPFALSIGSACAGVNSVVGFLVVGSGVAYPMIGSRARKLLWIVAGIALIWVLNVVRIEAIFLAGVLAGQDVALEVLHPVAGLVVFNLGVLLMLLVTGRFGLALPGLGGKRIAARVASPVRRTEPALALAFSVALLLAAVNTGYARFAPVAGTMGDAQEMSFIADGAVRGWKPDRRANYSFGRPYFGAESTWQRIIYRPDEDAEIRTEVPLYVDVISTPDADRLAAYNVEACYNFHGFEIANTATRELARGVEVTIVDYVRPRSGTQWTALWWEWPYLSNDRLWYERIVLLVPDGPNATFDGLPADVAGLSGDAAFADTERFVITLAGDLIDGHFAAVDELRSAAAP